MLLKFVLLLHILFLASFHLINVPVELQAPVFKISFNHFAKYPVSCWLLFEFSLCILNFGEHDCCFSVCSTAANFPGLPGNGSLFLPLLPIPLQGAAV